MVNTQQITYKDYTLQNIFDTTDTALKQTVIDFWLSNKVLPLEIAEHRVDQVVHVFYNKHNEIIGLNTAYLYPLMSPSDNYYFIRMFIKESDRRSSGLVIIAVVKSFVFFRDNPQYRSQANGIVLAIENDKLTQKGLQKWLKRQGLSYAGKNASGQDLWFARFDDPLLQDLQ